MPGSLYKIIWRIRKIFRLLLACIISLFVLFNLSIIFRDNLEHFNLGRSSKEEWMNGLLTHEKILYILAGADAVIWGYAPGAIAIVLLCGWLCSRAVGK